MEDPLGSRSDCVDLEELTRWNFTQLPMTSEDKDAEISPFPWRNDLNSKLILWYGFCKQEFVSSHLTTLLTLTEIKKNAINLSRRILKNITGIKFKTLTGVET